MTVVNWILNFAGLLLWINWRSLSLESARATPPASLLSTLRRAEPRARSRWLYLISLVILLWLRSLFYWHIGSEANLTLALDLTAVTLPFRCDHYGRMLLFSVLSFSVLLGTFYSWLLLVSVINRRVPDTEPMQRVVRLHLGWLERCPVYVRVLLPMIVSVLLWSGSSPGLVQLGIIPSPLSKAHLWEQAAVLGMTSYLSWEFLLLAILGAHVITGYVYFGSFPFMNFISLTARNLAQILDWLPLRLGKVDLSPLVGAALALAIGEAGSRWLPKLFQRLPL